MTNWNLAAVSDIILIEQVTYVKIEEVAKQWKTKINKIKTPST